MAIEIERKFLIVHDSWRALVSKSARIRQGYLSSSNNASVRVRTDSRRGWINVKSVTLGVQRQEFEYEIPLADAEQMLNTLAMKPLIEKTRHYVNIGSHTWEVDEFEAANSGLIIAELELQHAGEAFERPTWIGAEVTDDARYYNTNLAKEPFTTWRHQTSAQPKT